MGLIFRKEFMDYIVLFIILTALCSSDKVSSQVFTVDEEVTDVALIVYSSALLQNNLIHVVGQMLQDPKAGTRLSWEQTAKLSWLHENLKSHRLSTLSMIPAAQKLLLTPTAIPPEEQLSLILHETCFNYWDDSLPIHNFKISSVLTVLPKALKTVNVFHLVSTARCTNGASFLNLVFKRLKQGTVFLSSPLLYGILHTYPFACILPDLQEALDYVSKEIMHKENVLIDLYIKIPLQQNDLETLLLDILKLLVSNQSPLSQKAKLRIQIILPYLTTETCKYMYTYSLSVNSNYNLLFSALKDSDYPADVRDVKYTLVAALESKELDLRKYLVGFDSALYGNNRLSLLLAFLQKLYFSLPNAHPASAYVSTLLPYVKFKYIASKGGSYIPRTSLDIAALLNAFNTIGELSEAKNEVYKALTKDIKWESILHNFHYYEYTDPRSLLISMIQNILSHNRGYKLCHKLIMQYFLEKANNVTQGCSSNIFNYKHNETYSFTTISKPIDILLEGPMTNLSSMVVTYKPRETKISTPTKYAKQNENTITKYPLNTTETPFGKQRKAQQIQEVKCKVNGTVDGKINSIIDILYYLEEEEKEVFPVHVNIECTDSDQKKLYISSINHSDCNTVTHLPTVREPKIITTDKPFMETVQHTRTYSLETAPFTIKEKDAKETTEITSASTIIDEETSTLLSDNESVESQTKESVSTLEPTTAATSIFSGLLHLSLEPKHKLEQKSTVPEVMDRVTLSPHQTTYIPKESSLEDRDSLKIFNTLDTTKAKETDFTTSRSIITKDETVLPKNVVQTEKPMTEVTIPFQEETTQNYKSTTIIPNIMKDTKTDELEAIYTVTTTAQKMKEGEHTVETTIPETSDTKRFRQAIISKSSHTRTQALPIATTPLPDTMKSFEPAAPAYTSEKPEWEDETKESSTPNEQMFTSVVPAAKTSLKTPSLTVSSTNMFINKTSNITECTELPNVIYILRKLNISQESINIIKNIILLPEARRALKYFKFAENELPRKILIRLLSFLKYYIDLNTVDISIIDEVLYKINADSSIINESLKIINICTDKAGVIKIMLPSAALEIQEHFWTADYKGVYVTTANEVQQTMTEETTTHTEEIPTSVPKITAEMMQHKLITVTSESPLELSLTKYYENLTEKSLPQAQKISNFVTEGTPIGPILGQIYFPTQQVNIIECIKMPNITSLLTAIPHVSKDSISTIINNILKPEFLAPLKQFRFKEFEVPVILLRRFLNFIKYYTEPSPKVIRAIDDILQDININTYPVNLTLQLSEICITDEGKMEMLVPTMSSLEPLKGNASTETVRVEESTETLAGSEDISISITPPTENFTRHLQENTLPVMFHRKISINKTSSIIECIKLPNVTYHLKRLHVLQEFALFIENIILTPKVLLTLKHFKFMENESVKVLLIRLLNFVKYYAELNIMDLRIIDQVLSIIKLVSSFKNEPLRIMDICMDKAGVVQMSPSVTSLEPTKLSFTTDFVTVDKSTEKEVMQTVTLESIPQSEYISTSILETTPRMVEEILPSTSIEPQELTLTTDYKAPDVTNDKEFQTLIEEATTQEMSSSEPQRLLTTTSSVSPALTVMADYKVMHVTAKEELEQAVTENALSQTETISTSVPESITRNVEELSTISSNPPELSLTTSYESDNMITDKEVLHKDSADAMIHTEKTSTSKPETVSVIMKEMSPNSIKSPEVLTTDSVTVNMSTEKKIMQTVTLETIQQSEYISNLIPKTTPGILEEISPRTSTEPQEIALTTGYKAPDVTTKKVTQTLAEDTTTEIEGLSTFEKVLTTDSVTVNMSTEKKIMQTVTLETIQQSEYVSNPIPKTTPGILEEISPRTSTEPQEIALTTGYKAPDVTTKKVTQTLAEDTTTEIEGLSTFEAETSLTTTSSELPELSMMTGYKVMHVTAKEEAVQAVTEKVIPQRQPTSTSVLETIRTMDEVSLTSLKPLELSLTTGYESENVITDTEVLHTATADTMIHTEKSSTSIPETTAEIRVTSTKPLELSLITDNEAVDVITDKEVAYTASENATAYVEKISTSIAETTAEILYEMTPTSTKPLELSYTTGYEEEDETTAKEVVHAVIENAEIAETTEMPTSTNTPEDTSVQPIPTTSTKSLQRSLMTSTTATSRETTLQSEKISNSIMEFTDISPSLVPVSLATVTELMNKTTNIVDCIELPNITSLLTAISPTSRESLSLFLKYLLQPEVLESLKQFKFMEKEAPIQVLSKFLKFIKLYTQPSPKVLSTIDDTLLYMNNNIISVPLDIMRICTNKEGAVEAIWAGRSPLEPTKAFGIDVTEHFNASPTSTTESFFNFTGEYQMDTTRSPTFYIHKNAVVNTERIPTSEKVEGIIETTTNQLSTEWNENQILEADYERTTQEHTFSTSRTGLEILETLTNTIAYPETKITDDNMKLMDHSVTSHGFRTARKEIEIKAITSSVPKYQRIMETAESDTLTSIAATEPETLETEMLKQTSVESQHLLDITATSEEPISLATDTINLNKDTAIPNVEITATNSIYLETTSTATQSATDVITETESLGILDETTYEPLTTETSITEVYSTKLPNIVTITETVTTSAITEVPNEPASFTEMPHITQPATKRMPLEEIESTEKLTTAENFKEISTILTATSQTMPKMPIFAIDSTHKIGMTSTHSEVMSTRTAVTQELSETTTEPAKTEITKLPAEKTVIEEQTNESANTMDHFSLLANTRTTPYEAEEHLTTASSTISEAVTQKISLTLSNEIHAISSSKIICTAENNTPQTNIQQLECIKIPDVSLLLKTNYLSQDLLNALNRILCRKKVLSLLKSFEIPETSTAANAIRRFLIFLKYNVEPDAQTTKVINEIMKNIQFDSVGSGIVTNEICFNPPLVALSFTNFPRYSKAHTLPTEVSSEITDILHKGTTAENKQTTQSVTSTFTIFDSSKATEHAETRYDDHTSTNIFPISTFEESTEPTIMISPNIKEMKTSALTMSTKNKEKTILPYATKWYRQQPYKDTSLKASSTVKLTEPSILTTEQIFAPYINDEISESITTEITTAIDSSFSTTFASPVSTSKKSTVSLSEIASTSLPTQSDDDKFHRPTLPNLTNIIHKEERKAYTIYPYVMEQPSYASWYYDGNIIVPKECPHGSMTHMLIVDVISLFEALYSKVPNKLLKHLIDITSTPETVRELKILDWTKYNNKHTFLKDVFTFLIINSTYTDDIKNELINVLHNIRPYSNDELPTFKFICIPSVHFPFNKTNDYEEVSVLKITTNEHCNANNSYNVVISIPIAPLFKCIDDNAPRLVKVTFMDLLSRDGISSLLSHFNASHYKTNGELLHGLLTYLSYTPSLEDNVLQSIRILLSFTKLVECGALEPTLTTECININEIESMGYTSTFEASTTEDEQTVTPETFPEVKITKHILDLQLEECTENKTYLFVIDMPELFQAVKPEIGSNLQRNIMNMLEKPEMQMKLKELPWETYVTKAELLSDVLSYILSKITQKELSHAIRKIASNIQYDGPGTEHPKFKFVCVNFGKMYLNEMEKQMPHLITPTTGECNNGSNAVMLINIDSLLQSVKQEASPLAKAIAIALFQRKDFYTKLSELKFENSTSSGIVLRNILNHLIENGELESPSLGPVKELLKHIQLDGPGAQQLDIRKECQTADFPPLWENVISNEEKKNMIIPFQCNDNITFSGRFTVDIPSLFLGINITTEKFVDQITEYFKTFKGQQLLDRFQWEAYETGGKMLKDLLLYVASAFSENDDIYVAIQKLLPLLHAEDNESLPLVLKFECDANAANNYCENNSTPLWVVNITSLFKTLSNDTPEMPKQLLSSYLSRLDVYKDLPGFSVHGYNTKSEFLWKLLTYIMLQNPLSYKLHRAAAELVTHINWGGPGMEKIDVNIVCNITSEAPNLDFHFKSINMNQEESIIKINSQCHENGTVDILDVDFTLLIKILPKDIRNKIYNSPDLLNSSRIKNKLKEFKWDVHHERKHELLKEILTMLFELIPLEINALNQIDKYIHKMNNIIETAVPLLSYRCINSRENYSHTAVNKTQDKQLNEITGGLAIMQPTYGKCQNENNSSNIPIIVVNIANLFKALKPNTSVLAKSIIISHMTHTEFYKQITGFNLEGYKTRGQQLQQLLAFLATTTSDPILLKAIDKLLQNVLLDGPGQLPPVYRIVCNTTLNHLIGITKRSNSSSDIMDIFRAETENVSLSVLEPCIEGSSGMTYKINIPSLFYALKTEAPQESLAIVARFIAKPTFPIQLKGFDPIRHKTQGDLLHAMLSFISKKADTPSYVEQALEDILPFVHSVALGKKIPKITFNCLLPNFQETVYDEQIFPEQGVNIVNKEGLPCNYITSNSEIIKGRTVYIFDIPTMINIFDIADHEKKLITTFLKSPAFQKYLQISAFRFSTNNAKTIEHLLLLLQENLNLQQNETEIVQNMISKVQEIQETYIPPVLIMKCTTDTSLKESLWEASNQTCFLPLQYSTGIAYDLQWDALLEAMSPQTPSNLIRKLERFLNITHKKVYLEGFNIFQYRTRGTLLKDLLVFLALKPSLNLEYKNLMSSLVPYVQLHGMGYFAPTVISDCPKSDTEYVTESTDAATETLSTTTLPDPCFLNPNSILINQFHVTSLFTTLDKEAPSDSVSVIKNYLQDDDIQEKLHGFDVKKYETKNDLLQGLLAYVWSDQNSPESEKAAAKTLLPHIMFNVTEEPPILKTACYVPKTFYIRYVDEIPKSLTLVYPTEKACLHNLAHIPGTIVYRITISTLFKALHPKLQVKEYLPVAKFLSKPYAYKYVQGINIERYQTRGELLRAVLTFLRFSQKYMEHGIKDALIKMLPLIQLDGSGNLPVDTYTECSLVLEEDKSSSLQLQDVLKSIEQSSLNAESHDAYLTIFDFLTSPGFNLTHYVSWLDEKRILTNGELLKIILLQIYDKNPNMGRAAMLLMPHVEEHKGIGGKRAKIETFRYKEVTTPYEINFLELLKVIKPEAPKRAVSYVFNLFGKQDIYKNLKNFDPDEYETQGELLVGILKFLEIRYATNSTIGTHVKDLIPFVDMANIGALPPIVKTIYITFNTSVSVFRLDLTMLYKLFPKEKLTLEQQHAINEIFKFLSTKGYKLPELFQGLSSRFPFQIQIKLILEKLLLIGEEHLKVYANDMLQVLEQNMPQYSSQDELIPEMDWIEVLHAIPDSDVPSEVIAGKKELYRFFLSASFKTIIKNYRVNLSVSRGKFLKDLLSYLRSKPDVSCIKVLKRAISYVFMFIREVGAGAMSVQDDIILPEQQEEARSARNRIKELLYQVLGVIEQEGAFEILQTLQRLFDSTTKLNLVTTYLGYDVLEEFPPKERLITILRRIYHNFIMFLDQDTISAIDMVFISLGETKQQTSEILHFLPVDMETLLKTVLGPDTPPLVVAASDFIRSNINLNTIPLGKAFQDTVPSVLNLDVRKRLTVILRILWRVFSKYDDAKIHQSIRTVYEYLQPNKLGNELSTQEHHMAVVAALKGLIRTNSPKKVQKAKNNVIEQLANQQNVYDKVLAYLVTQNLSPKHLIAKALRRFREHQLKMNPKLWSSVSVIFDYLHIPEYESIEEETEGNIDIVDELKYLVDEAGIEVAPAKRILMKYIIDKKPKLHKLFRAQHILLQYPQAEKMSLILNRLLNIYGDTLEPEIFSAAGIILNHLDVLVKEVDINEISINEIFNSAINDTAPKNVIKAKRVIQEMLNNVTVLHQVLQTVIIQKDFTPERQLVTILRQFYNIFKPQLQKPILQFLTTLFDYLKVSLDSSVEDQFVGNFTFKPIFKHIFPEKEIPEYVTKAVDTILGLLNSEQVDIKQLLYGVHLWKLPVVSQVSIILYRLTKIPYINKEVRDSIDTLLDGLGIDFDELASEDIDESYTPDKLFNEAIGHRSTLPEVQEAKGILMKFLLSGSSKVKNVYRGIDFKNIPQPKDRLVAVLKNMYNKRNTFGEKMTEALDVISNFLQVDFGNQKIDPYTFDFDGILEQVVPIAAPLSVRQARNLFLKAVKNRPGTFKKILDNVNVTEYETENEIVSKILNATQHYNRPLSKHLRTATNQILDYLHGVPIKEETNDYNSKEDADIEEDGIGFRMFEDEFKPRRKWKIKKKLRRYD